MEFVTDFDDPLKQKAYTNNIGAATASCLGKLKGLTYMAGSANDSEIGPILDQVHKETNYALIHGIGINEESQIKFSKTAKVGYIDHAIVDLVAHIARDPIRGLGPQDRFIRSMRVVLSAGIRPKTIALGATAVLYFDNPENRDTLRLEEMHETKGIDYVLKATSEIDPQGRITVLIEETIAELRAKGWIKEGTSA